MASCKICGEKEPVMYCVCAGCMDKLPTHPDEVPGPGSAGFGKPLSGSWPLGWWVWWTTPGTSAGICRSAWMTVMPTGKFHRNAVQAV